MQIYKLIPVFIIMSIFLGCSKLQKELPQPTSPGTVHNAAWNDTASADFHGKYLKAKNWKKDDCVQCHAVDFSGGTSRISCYDCHNSYPHKKGWIQSDNVFFHGVFLKNNNWDLMSCKICHGIGYDGGSITNVSCMTSGCHLDENQNKKSPEACNTCHGNFSSPENLVVSWAPPRGIDGSTDSTHRSVGAHQVHIATGKLGKNLKCGECHNVPANVFTNGHIDSDLPAEVVMNDTLSRLITANGTLIPNPSFNNSDLKCSNTYCHGNWKLRKAASTNQFGYADSIMVGANFSPKWVGGAVEAACGTCHALPPTGHIASSINACANCHSGVVNNAGVIIDKSKHINGKINVFGQEKWMN